MRLGICEIPEQPHPWVVPPPNVDAWEALRAIYINDVRLQFDFALASPSAGVWDTKIFDIWFKSAVKAGMRVHVNVVSGVKIDATGKVTTPVPAHHDAKFRRVKTRELAQAINADVASWGIGNEPGFGEWMGNDVSRGGTADYIRDVYFPEFVNSVEGGIRDAGITARVTGFEADSPEIQKRCVAAAKEFGLRIDAETVHPYGDVGGGDYATMKKFAAVRSTFLRRPSKPEALRPWIVGEIDHQQLPGATNIATDEQIRTLQTFIGDAGFDYPDLECVFLGSPDYFFTRRLATPTVGEFWNPTEPDPAKRIKNTLFGVSWSTWTLPEREYSDVGRELAQDLRVSGWY